eukprot:scaffold23661_cov113-Isochrysis_galbana.AAC.4
MLPGGRGRLGAGRTITQGKGRAKPQDPRTQDPVGLATRGRTGEQGVGAAESPGEGVARRRRRGNRRQRPPSARTCKKA